MTESSHPRRSSSCPSPESPTERRIVPAGQPARPWYTARVRRLLSVAVLVLVAWVGLAAAEPAAAEPGGTEESAPHGRSSFWGSDQPSKGGSYRYRLLGIGIGLAAVTGFIMWRLVRRASAERAAANR